MEVGVKMENLTIRGLKVIPKIVHPRKLRGQYLLIAGQLDSKEVEHGVKYLLKNNLNWKEEDFTAVGFPKVFYLKYHGYASYFRY